MSINIVPQFWLIKLLINILRVHIPIFSEIRYIDLIISQGNPEQSAVEIHKR